MKNIERYTAPNNHTLTLFQEEKGTWGYNVTQEIAEERKIINLGGGMESRTHAALAGLVVLSGFQCIGITDFMLAKKTVDSWALQIENDSSQNNNGTGASTYSLTRFSPKHAPNSVLM